jgi:two-component system NtrC family response regulator
MPLLLQAKILRFLQERSIERVGGHSLIAVDLRIVCATHRPIGEMLAQRAFRDDLYFRLAEIVITVPALRDRTGDAVLMAHAFLRKFAPERRLKFTPDAIAALSTWNWPGNVRELESRVRRACIMADGVQISAKDLEIRLDERPLATAVPLNLKQVRDEAERNAVTQALHNTQNNLAQAARLLGISRPTLYNLLEKFHIDHHEE